MTTATTFVLDAVAESDRIKVFDGWEIGRAKHTQTVASPIRRTREVAIFATTDGAYMVAAREYEPDESSLPDNKTFAFDWTFVERFASIDAAEEWTCHSLGWGGGLLDALQDAWTAARSWRRPEAQ